MKLSTYLAFVPLASAAALHHKSHAPIVNVCNGTYEGAKLPQYNQDVFLGIPYAQPPTGDLRFHNPKSLNQTWKDVRSATKYSPACVGYGPSQMGYNVSEDCLYLNVIRPSDHNATDGGLPVAVWIHGGGFVQGSGVDLRYNLSFIVEQSVQLGMPMIGITLNYRLGAWGFLQGFNASENVGSNFGIRDQRLALHWIKENIAAFGGDPNKVTIWGQSAGAASVGLQITAYGGRDDGLFRSAIMQSGAPIFISDQKKTAYFESVYRNLTASAECSGSTDSLTCLRKLPYEKLNAVLNTTAYSSIWQPQIDGDIIQRYSSEQLAEGAFVQVPIIAGANSDEGTAFSPKGINSSDVFERNVKASNPRMNNSIVESVLELYPDDPSSQILANLPASFHPGPPEGPQYRRAATYYGDTTMIANRRQTCETWASFNLTAYCFRFDAIPAWATQMDGATHFVEVAFTMLTLSGVGYPPVRKNPFEGKPESYADLARLMSSDWVSFVANGNVAWAGRESHVPSWPEYDLHEPEEFVYDANRTSFVEADTYRREGIELIKSLAAEIFGR